MVINPTHFINGYFLGGRDIQSYTTTYCKYLSCWLMIFRSCRCMIRYVPISLGSTIIPIRSHWRLTAMAVKASRVKISNRVTIISFVVDYPYSPFVQSRVSKPPERRYGNISRQIRNITYHSRLRRRGISTSPGHGKTGTRHSVKERCCEAIICNHFFFLLVTALAGRGVFSLESGK